MNVGSQSFDLDQILMLVAGFLSGIVTIFTVIRIGQMYIKKDNTSTNYVSQETAAKGYLSVLGEGAMVVVAIWCVIYVLPKLIGFLTDGIGNAI